MSDKYISAKALTLSLRDDPYLNAASFARVKRHIEAAPDMVKRGRWVDGMVRDWRCSECGKKVPRQVHFDGYCYNDKLNFCPNCGADMRGTENG